MKTEAMEQDEFRSVPDRSDPRVLFENVSNSMVHLEGDRRGEPLCGRQRKPLTRTYLSDCDSSTECPACAAVARGDLEAPVDECPRCEISIEDMIKPQMKKPGSALLTHIHDHVRADLDAPTVN